MQGNSRKAIENYEQALSLHLSIARTDSKDFLAQGVVAYDLAKLGNALLADGKIEDALERHEQSVAMLEKIHLANPENVMVWHTLALSLEGLAGSLKAKRNFEKAIAVYDRSLRIEERLNAKAENLEFQIKIAQLYFKLGQIRQDIDKLKPADQSPLCKISQKDFQKSIEVYTEVKKRRALSPTNLEILSQAIQITENTDCRKPDSN